VARFLVILVVFFGPRCLVAQAPDALGSAPRFTLREVTEFGGMDPRPEYSFSTVRDVALLPTDQVAVADGGSQEIRFFDLEGQLLTVVGGRGDGPGEFRAIREFAVLPGGPLLVWDIQRQSVTVFDGDREVSVTYRVDARPEDMFFPVFGGAFTDGSILIRDQIHPMGMRDEPSETRRDPITLFAYGPSGPIEAYRWTFDGPERDFYSEDGRWGFDDPLFAKDLTHTVLGDTVFVAHTDSAWIRRFTGGSELSPWRLWGLGRTATGTDVEAERAARLAELEAESERRGPHGQFDGVLADMRAEERNRIERIRALERLPALARLLRSDDGHLWIQGFPDRSLGVVEWYRVTADGIVSGHLALPLDEELMAITDSWLGVVRTDHLGVETVVLYRIDSM
jgi:hypothetical protein